MTAQRAATTARTVVMLALVAWAVMLNYSVRSAEHIVLGTVLTGVAVLGLFVQQGRVRSYVVGASCVFFALLLGSVSGPFFTFTGYCDSVFEPFEQGHVLPDDAPPGTRHVCEAVRQERMPVIAVLTVVGLGGLVLSVRKRQVAVQLEEPASDPNRIGPRTR